MWDSPIYRFNRPAGTLRGKQRYENIVIDVTRSAPPFSAPGKTLTGVLAKAIKTARLAKENAVLDFGAGKLRNALHLLKQGYGVCAVEYEKLFHESPQAASARTAAERYRTRFCRLVYPNQFEASRQKFDLVLLINVLNVMPVPAERLLVLQQCRAKLRPGGHLLWYTQRGDADYADRLVPKYALGDGHYIGRNAKYKTFYREFTVSEIDALLARTGFEFVSALPASSRNQARLYKRTSSAAIAGVLDQDKIQAARVVDETIPNPETVKPRRITSVSIKRAGNPNPGTLRVPALLIDGLKGIPVGSKAASQYQHLVKEMIETLFSPQELRDLRTEEDIFSGRKRLDILASNKSRAGFFYSLKADENVTCPTIVIECKNYSHEVGNPEFDQLGSRLGRKLGMVGILAYRNAKNFKTVVARCRDFFDNESKIIIPLNDADFVVLLNLKIESRESEIEDFLDRRKLEVKAG
jgi:SAM-dependent methyltransferase